MIKYKYRKNKIKKLEGLDMEDENEELKSYYEITYLDDNNTTHFGRVKDVSELNFMQNRFDVKEYNFVSR
jgi:predicted phosphatase